MNTALIIDWMMTAYGGAEKVNESICQVFKPHIYTLIQDKEKLKSTIFEKCGISTSFIQKLPFAKKKFRNYFPLFPFAIEQFDLSSYDLVLSSSHSFAKGALTHSDQLHICYCHTPIRYAWDMYHEYLSDAKLNSGLKGKLAKFFLHYIRMWDVGCAPRVDEFIANSKCVAKRIKKIYGKDAKVIYPPVETDFFSLQSKKDNYYLAASRLVPYKKMDVIVEAFSKMPDKKLVIIGSGPDLNKVKKKAVKNVEILGEVPNLELKKYLQNAKGFIFASLEDFGIVPLEAQSCGTPVIAYGRGGALETVIDQKTGTFFNEQTPQSIVDAVKRFEKMENKFDSGIIQKHARQFSTGRFQREMKEFIDQKYLEFQSGL